MAKDLVTVGKKPRVRPRNFVRQWRKYRRLTQEQLAGQAGISVAAVSQIETGDQGYSAETLQALADALGCVAGDLLRFDPTDSAYQLWLRFSRLRPDQAARANRVLEALDQSAT